MNMGMTVRKVTDPAFKAYGRIITGYDFSGLLKAMEQTPLPEDVIYIPSLPEMEALPAAKELEKWNLRTNADPDRMLQRT